MLPFVLTVRNPQSGSIWLQSVDYALSVEGAEAGKGSYRKSEEAGAGGSLSAPFELEIDTRALGEGIYGSGGPSEARYRLVALVRIETSRGEVLELSHAAEGSFAILREPGFRIRSVTIERDLLVTTKLAMDLEIDNPNVFPIDFSSLSYDFYGEGAIWANGRSDDAATVPASGSVERTLSFTMNFASMDRSLFDLVANLRVVRYRLKGEAKIATGLAYLPEFATRFDSEGSCEVRR
jgi:LEA14-like dessication related protein